MKRQQAVSMKINKYLLKADDLYQTYLVSGDGQQVTWNRWGVSRVFSSSLRYQYLLTPAPVSFIIIISRMRYAQF